MKLELIKEVATTGDIFYNIYKDDNYLTGYLSESEAREKYAIILQNEFVAPKVILSTENEIQGNGKD